MSHNEIKKRAPVSSKDALSAFDDVKGPFTTSARDGVQKIVFAKKGVAAKEADGGCPSKTIPELLKIAAEKKASKPALRVERPLAPFKGAATKKSEPRDSWKTWTYKQYYEDAKQIAKAFMHLGLQQHDSVNIFGFNSPEWFLSEVGAMFAGAKAAGVYPSDTAEQLQFKSFHSDAAIATCEGEKELAKYESIIDRLPYLKAIVCWSFKPTGDITRADGSVVKVMTWDDMLALGDKVEDSALEERLSKIEPGHCCSLIYTSGTTGNPKAVMISHDNLCFEAGSVLGHLDFLCNNPSGERALSYLPLSHVAGMMVDIITPIIGSATKPGYITMYFARPYDLKAGTLKDRLQAVEPTFFLGVPRVWEKIAEKIKAIGKQTKGLKKKIATWGKAKGLEYQLNCQIGKSGDKPFMYGLAEKLVHKKVRGNLGLLHCKFGFTGAAPITTETLEFFGGLGININEVYGMSECTGAVTWSLDSCHQWGSCGFAMAGTEVKIFKVDPSDINKKEECPDAKDPFNATEEEQGEICFRGRNTMMGYLANPKLGAEHVKEIDGKNAGAVDMDGWLHSGDKGCKSKLGMIKITGRYKELIIGAGGENIAPVPIEDNIKLLCPAVSNIMMVGDKRKFNVAVLTLKAVGASGELPGGNKLDAEAAEINPKIKTIEEAMDDKAVIDTITKAIKATNATGAVVPSNASKIQKFTIVPRDFSVETEELTATLKLKRGVVAAKYHDAIEAMYASDKMYVKYTGPMPASE